MTPERLLIVYNADSGLIAGAKDSLHKLLSPESYPCSLCALTHGALRMNPAWKRFVSQLPLESQVYHRPDFRARYPDLALQLPAVLIERNSTPDLLIGAEELEMIDSVEALIGRIQAKLQTKASTLSTNRITEIGLDT